MSLGVPLHDALHEKQAPHSFAGGLFSRQGPSILVPDCCTWGLLAAISTAADKRFIVAGDVTTVSLNSDICNTCITHQAEIGRRGGRPVTRMITLQSGAEVK